MVWGKVKLGEVCRIEKGNIGILKAIQGDYPLVVLGEERRTHNEYQFNGEAVVIPLVSSTGHGDRSMKRIHFQSGKFSIGSILCAVMPKDSSTLSAEFLYRYLDLNKERELVSRMKGMANVSLSIKSIAEVEIPLPPINIQKKIVNSFKYIETQTNTLCSEFFHQLGFLKKLRQQILQDAMKGKLLNSSPPREELTITTAFGHPSSDGGEQIRNFGPNSSPPREGEYPQGEGVIDYKKISNLPLLKTFRKELRSHLTPAEATLWTLLSNRKLQGRKFRRQHSVGNYILDFFCPEEKLAVELDGEVHMNTIAEQYDRDRDIFLQYTGIKVLRFENRMVFDLLESLLREIEENFGWDKKITTPAFGHPSLKGGEHEQMEDARVLLEKIRAEKQQLIAQGKIKKEKTLPAIKPEEIPFEIPDNWVWCRLVEIISILGDGLHGTPKYTENGEYYFVNGNNLMNGKILIKQNTKRVAVDEYYKYKKSMDFNTILVSINGTLGNLAFYNGEKIILGKSACYFNLCDGIDKYFIGILIRSLYFLKYAVDVASETTIKNVSLKSMRNFPIPLPPLPEQHRIVRKVEQLMKLCDELEQSIQQNQKYTQELLQVALKEALEPKEED